MMALLRPIPSQRHDPYARVCYPNPHVTAMQVKHAQSRVIQKQHPHTFKNWHNGVMYRLNAIAIDWRYRSISTSRLAPVQLVMKKQLGQCLASISFTFGSPCQFVSLMLHSVPLGNTLQMVGFTNTLKQTLHGQITPLYQGLW